jgi:hypothetical protein
MSSKKQKSDASSLPQRKGEVWEIGRRRLSISIAELDERGEHPELLLAIQPDEDGGIVLADVVPSSAPIGVLGDFVARAMAKPKVGEPRRPSTICVGSQAEADMLAEALAGAGVSVEVKAQLEMLDVVCEHAGRELGSGMSSDYRSEAIRSDQSLSEEGLLELYQVAKKFFKRQLWDDFDESELFEIGIEYPGGSTETLYGVVMGMLEEVMGLALYSSVADLERVYAIEQERSEKLGDGLDLLDAEPIDEGQLEEHMNIMYEILKVPSVALTYSDKADALPPIVEEAKELKLPLANKSAYPVIMATGEGHLQLARPDELRRMYLAMRAILDWDDQIAGMDVDDDLGVTVSTRIAPVADFTPEVSVRTTLIENPVERMEDEGMMFPDVDELLEIFERPPSTPPAPAKAAGKKPTAKKKACKKKSPSK